MTEAEKNEIVGLVMTEISSQAVDFDINTEQPQANDLLTAVREVAGRYVGVTLKWDDVARIATEVANRAAERAEQAETDANNILTQVQSKGTEITNFVATSKTEIETQKNESVEEVRTVYQSDLNELKGDLIDLNGLIYKDTIALTQRDRLASSALTSSGNKTAKDGCEIARYYVVAGQKIHLKLSKYSDGVYQFSRDSAVSSTYRIGNTITTAVDELIEVPTGATYLFVSQDIDNTSNIVSYYTDAFTDIEANIEANANDISKINNNLRNANVELVNGSITDNKSEVTNVYRVHTKIKKSDGETLHIESRSFGMSVLVWKNDVKIPFKWINPNSCVDLEMPLGFEYSFNIQTVPESKITTSDIDSLFFIYDEKYISYLYNEIHKNILEDGYTSFDIRKSDVANISINGNTITGNSARLRVLTNKNIYPGMEIIAKSTGIQVFVEIFSNGSSFYKSGWKDEVKVLSTVSGILIVNFRKSDDSTLYANDYDYYVAYKYSDIPSYWEEHIVTKENQIFNRITSAGSHGDSFAFITDTHWENNRKQSPRIMKKLYNNLPLSMIVHGGDIIQGQSTINGAISIFNDYFKKWKYENTFYIRGNHDANNDLEGAVGGFDISKFYSMFTKIAEQHLNTNGNTWYYKDNQSQKIRYIFIDTWTPASASIPQEEISWISDIISSTIEGWTIIVFQHIGFEIVDGSKIPWRGYMSTKTSIIVNTIKDAIPIGVNFAGIISGHTHTDIVEYTSDGLMILSTTCDTNGASKNDPTAPNRDIGTIREQAFDVFTIDTFNKKIYATRIGAGCDRIINYDIIPCNESITLTTELDINNGTWVSYDTSIATVNDGVVTKVSNGNTQIRYTTDIGEIETWCISTV